MDPEPMSTVLDKTIDLKLPVVRLLERLRTILHRPGFLLASRAGRRRTGSADAGYPKARRLVMLLLDALQYGELRVDLPDATILSGQGKLPGPSARIVLHRPQALWRLLCGGDLGLAEAYIEGEWSTPDLPALLELAALNLPAWDADLAGTWPVRAAARLAHLACGNSRRGSRRNIVAHYDLGNDFYAAWLDASMSYSSALYDPPGLDLERAQRRKQDRVLELLELQEGMDVLEIGCGWGELIQRLHEHGAGSVVGLTLSDAQAEYARQRLAGLLQTEVRLQDYRDVGGIFDRIVSVEMFEAVGAARWPLFFSILAARLAPGGIAVMQVITIAEQRYARYASRPDFIQAHIFPGGMLPTSQILLSRCGEAGLRMEPVCAFAQSYAQTLADWAQRFENAWPALRRQGLDEAFRRKWRYYLSYCEAGFRAGHLDVGLYRITHASGPVA